MFNSIIKSLNGHGSEAESLDAALVQLSRDLDETNANIAVLKERKRAALLDDASDTDLDKIERLIERAETRLEKLNMSEAPLRERLAGAHSAARKRRWDTLHADHHSAASKFLALARATAEEHSAIIAIVDTAQREGFAGLVASTMPRTPNIEGSPLLAPDLLDIFERAISPAPPRAEKTKAKAGAPASPVWWDHKHPDYNHPAAQQMRVATQPPAGVGMQHRVELSGGVPTPHLTAPRAPDDQEPLTFNQVRARVLRTGYSPADDRPQCHNGQIIRLPRKTAEAAAAGGALEIIEARSAKTEPTNKGVAK